MPAVSFRVLQDFSAHPVAAVHTQYEEMMEPGPRRLDVAIEFVRRCHVMDEGLRQMAFSIKGGRLQVEGSCWHSMGPFEVSSPCLRDDHIAAGNNEKPFQPWNDDID